jgi:hypothetical protein
MVTPVPHYVPYLPLDWMVGVVAVIVAILQEGDPDLKRRDEFYGNVVHERIDMNDYLPTSYDDMSSWRTVIGTLNSPARS